MATTLNGTGVTYPDGTSDTTHTPVIKTRQSLTGTSVDITGIPSWVKRVMIVMEGVSCSATANTLIQLGTASGFETTGYVGSVDSWGTTTSVTAWPVTGCEITQGVTASQSYSGIATFMLVTGNIWVMTFNGGGEVTGQAEMSAGTKALLGALTQFRITTTAGTATFDGGHVNVLYD